MYVYLSHRLHEGEVAWPDAPVLKIEQHDKIGENDSPCNTYIMHLPNHFGTHYDAPRHFNANGPSIVDLPTEYFVFGQEDILLLSIPKKSGECITKEDVEPYTEQISKAKLLLIKTGNENLRDKDVAAYKYRGPSAHPNFCKYLVENFSSLLCIGLDCLSLGSVCNDYATEAHHWLLGYYTQKFVTVIEDMKMMPLEGKNIRNITILPLRMIGIDSSPVTIIADIE